MEFTWELVVAGLDTALVIILLEIYKNRMQAAQAVQCAVLYESGAELRKKLESQPRHMRHYGGVLGTVQATACPISSRGDKAVTGVVRHSTLVEHKSQRYQGLWHEVRSMLRESLGTVPFCIRGGDEGCEVVQPLEAALLTSDLQLTHDLYVPTPAVDSLTRSIDRLFGEVSRGVQHTERMLTCGTRLLGFGELSVSSEGRLQLSPPLTGGYVLTTRTRDDVVQHFCSQASVVAIMAGVAAAVGALFAVYCWRRRLVEQGMLDDVLEGVRARRGGGMIGGEPCVICLAQPRELVLLPCGHVVLCADCCQEMLRALLCPLCRAHVDRIVPTYVG